MSDEADVSGSSGGVVLGWASCLGTRQSGMPEMRLVDLAAHGELIPVARDDARLALGARPRTQERAGAALRTLLYLFERDQAAGYLRSGSAVPRARSANSPSRYIRCLWLSAILMSCTWPIRIEWLA